MAQKLKTHIKYILLASVLLSGCQTTFEEDQTRCSKITQFALNHPVAAQANYEIGRASCREECRSRWSPYH